MRAAFSHAALTALGLHQARGAAAQPTRLSALVHVSALKSVPILRSLPLVGWGRNSANNVPRLKPEVGRMLQQELGPPLAVEEPPSNTGVYCVAPEG